MKAIHLAPPDPDRMNDKRSGWADAAIRRFRQETGTHEEDAVCDLVADLMHWCDRNGQAFDYQLARAKYHYEAETEGETPVISFGYERRPSDMPDRAHVTVAGKYSIAIIRTGEGLVIDVLPAGWDSPVDSFAVWDSEVDALNDEAEC